MKFTHGLIALVTIIFLIFPKISFGVDVDFDASVPDTTDPSSVTITSHTNGTNYTTITAPLLVTGTSADNSTGIGLNANSTTFTLKRDSDSKYWNGSAWVSVATPLSTTHSATNIDNVASWTSAVDLPPFSPDTYTIVATAVDKSGNSLSSNPVVFSASSSPSIPAPTIISPANGSVTGDSTPLVQGTGVAGLTISVEVEGTGDTYTTIVGIDGTWSVVLTNPLPQGNYTLNATQTDGATTSPIDSVVFAVGVPAPTITSPSEADVINDSTPTITGTGLPGATIVVTINETGETYSTVVDSGGNWSLVVADPLDKGDYTIEAIQVIDGVNSAIDQITFSVEAPVPIIISPTDNDIVDDTPTITGNGIPGATIIVIIPETGDKYEVVVGSDGSWVVVIDTALPDGPYSIEIVQVVDGLESDTVVLDFTVGLLPPIVISPGEGEVVTDSTPLITGTGYPGAQINIIIIETGQEFSVIVGEDGFWQIEVPFILEDGDYTLQISQTFRGVTSESLTVNFTVGAVSPSMAFLEDLNAFLAGFVLLGITSLSGLSALLRLPIGLPVAPPIFNFFAWFLAWLERKRKYGIIYDSVTREGIEGVTVRLIAGPGTQFEVGKLIESKKTGKKGEYVFNVPEGSYRLEVIKPQYRFASLRGSIGYMGELIRSRKGLLYVDVPMDNLSPLIFRKFISFKSIGQKINDLRLPVSVAGTMLAIYFVVTRGMVIDWVIVGLYAMIWLFEFSSFTQAKSASFIYSRSGRVPLAIIRVYDEQKLIATRVSMIDGQYTVFASAGKYLLEVAKKGYKLGSIKLRMARAGIIPKNIKLEPNKTL